MEKQSIDSIAKDMAFVRKAMILHLVSQGLSQEDVASLLGVQQSTISDMFPKGILKKIKTLRTK